MLRLILNLYVIILEVIFKKHDLIEKSEFICAFE